MKIADFSKWSGILLFAPLLFVACGDKEKWKEPTEVTVEYEVKLPDNSGNQEGLRINGGNLKMADIRLEGNRQQGDDVDFINETQRSFNFNSGNLNPDLSLDVPQGTYDRMDFSFQANSKGGPWLTLNARYHELGPGQPLPIVLKLEASTLFNARVADEGGSKTIILKKEEPRILKVEIDVEYWFSTITDSDWGNAQSSGGSGQGGGNNQVVVSKDKNSDIYSKIIGRVGGSLQVRMLNK